MQQAKGPAYTPPAPARVWVLLASEASTAVIFRRGPSRWTRLYLWDTRTDTFTPGSWFAGRLYELLSDLSPDGQHLVYVARNESKRRQERARLELGVKHFYSWTAVCTPPRVKALGLWNASGNLVAGGIFADNTKLWLNHDWRLGEMETLRTPPGLNVAFNPKGSQAIWIEAMKRTGWRVTQIPEAGGWANFKPPLILRKKALELHVLGRWMLPSGFLRQYVWCGPRPVPGLEGASWADFDQQGRLVYAREGRLYAVTSDGARELVNLNDDQPPGRPPEVALVETR
ncbi:hypothetical protein DAERI_170021 [Deinococcus aerius]|uniref:Uncharacterized protein n=1 Tax=Deinococcus aerius TaxID=200253 RepID=A0A2I9CZT7_9DEIO|nr:hypothetical protein DAERI_170021 [Deinococcus aerius]